MLSEKLKENFDGMIVYKRSSADIFSTLSVPAFIKDWFIKRYSDEDGGYNVAFMQEKLSEILPSKKDWVAYLDKIFHGGTVKFLAKLRIKANIKTAKITFSLPDFGVEYDETVIPETVWQKAGKDLLANGGDIWGVIELAYDNQVKKISKVGFKDFKPYKVDLAYYKSARRAFDFEEWLDVLIGAMGYNADGYDDENQKTSMLKRLLPFVEKRINLIELAPKGTGKSYVFSQISKRGWLNSGGVITRAKLFYDMSLNLEGLIPNYDYVALDEISTIRFSDVEELQGALKGYLESGTYTVGIKAGSGEAGFILLGNIPIEKMDENVSMFDKLPYMFHDSALLDRFHGFIKGWEMPRMRESLKAEGWALNTEYFAEIMHELRNDMTAGGVVNELLCVPEGSDTRDTAAVKRIATAFVKLYFPHWNSAADADRELFEKYCLAPAIEMRRIIKMQLGILDAEFRGKEMPAFKVREN